MPAIATGMKNHDEVSAIAVLRSVVVEKPEIRSALRTFQDIVDDMRMPRRCEDGFSVFHNPYSTKAEPLDRSVFDDGFSIQYSAEYVKEICTAYDRI